MWSGERKADLLTFRQPQQNILEKPTDRLTAGGSAFPTQSQDQFIAIANAFFFFLLRIGHQRR